MKMCSMLIWWLCQFCCSALEWGAKADAINLKLDGWIVGTLPILFFIGSTLLQNPTVQSAQLFHYIYAPILLVNLNQSKLQFLWFLFAKFSLKKWKWFLHVYSLFKTRYLHLISVIHQPSYSLSSSIPNPKG
jgi:hypothetical protein